MNEKERLVLQAIMENPYLSQQEMATNLSMSRPSLANTISTLIKKGEVIGRAYVLPEKNTIIAIGGANVDRKFHVEGNVQLATSNPATVTESVGGVARNIAENLGRLGNEVKLLTVLGQDQDAVKIEQHSTAFIQFDLVEKLTNESTGSYSAVLGEDGELVIALANMAIYDSLLPAIISKHEASLSNAKCIIVDLNCPKETVVYLQQLAFERDISFVIVPVSSPKMNRMPENLSGVSYFICNRDEAETYLKLSLEEEAHYEEAVKQLLQKGAEHVILTRGEYGVIAGSKDGITRFNAVNVEQIVDVTGAGDAFVSAFLHGVLHQESFTEAIKFGLYNSAQTLKMDSTVRTDLSHNEITKWREQ
ncbi:carbohydrate kinase [Lysinibacillus sp. 54212]|uniref:carbohydrate kinase n=1 Tax=Lysinibacillus sp. 54212 TaxID=3119829 RepID=UPI002FCC239B